MQKSTHTQKEKIWYATMRGCTIAVLLLLFFFHFTALAADFTPGIDLKTLIALLLFSLVLSYAQYIFAIRSIPVAARWIFHFFLVAFALFLVLLATTRTFLVGYILYAAVYAVFAVCSLLCRRRAAHKPRPADTKKTTVYTSRFS